MIAMEEVHVCRDRACAMPRFMECLASSAAASTTAVVTACALQDSANVMALGQETAAVKNAQSRLLPNQKLQCQR